MNRIEINVLTGEKTVVPVTEAELPVVQEPAYDYAALRAEAYRVEADPLFFQEQRGEVPTGTWLAKVNEIKARYPVS